MVALYFSGKLQNHKWENAFTIDSKSWGYRRNVNLNEILTTNQILEEVVSTVSCGGNVNFLILNLNKNTFLINIFHFR